MNKIIFNKSIHDFNGIIFFKDEEYEFYIVEGGFKVRNGEFYELISKEFLTREEISYILR